MPGLKHGLPIASDPDAVALRRVATRLAMLTAGLLLALLIGIVVAVYLTAQALMLGSLQDAVRQEARIQVSHLREAIAPEGGDQQDQTAPEIEMGLSGVAVSFGDRNLMWLGSDTTQFGKVLPDRASAATAIRQETPRYSTVERGTVRYLIYSLPVQSKGRVIGVVQSSASMRQYDQNIRTVLQVLLSVGGAALLALAGIATLVVRRALVPIRRSLRRQRDFVADAAHELRTPLTILHSAVELGLATPTPDEQQDALSQALVESRHLARLIDDLSLLARADSGALTLDMQPIDLESLVHETVNGVELLAEDQGLQLQTLVQGSTSVLGDRGRLRQLLVIMLDNALKHTPPDGSISIRVAEVSGRARLQVQDTGSGIDPQDLPYLFNHLYRAKRDRGTEGGGLGLAIARWIVDAHGGTITAANAIPHGAVFTVTLPLLRQVQGARSPASSK
jgi:signal transduction histidine kinase